VHVAWMASSLRLEAREQKLELRPTGSGVQAIHPDGRSEPVDLKGDAEAFIRAWLG
jgi:hypothetical protein